MKECCEIAVLHPIVHIGRKVGRAWQIDGNVGVSGSTEPVSSP